MKQRTLDDYGKYLQRYALKTLSDTAIAAVTPRHCEEFLAGLVRQQSRQGSTLAPATVKHAWSGLGWVLKYAVRHYAIPSNPADRVDFETNRATGDHDNFEPNPLTAKQVAQVSAAIAGGGDLPAYPVYALMVDFLAYTGLRAS
ncbi:phage integrase SAM-like domain-containing protein [Nocardia farcinica]|uniref:phage integrase SAM-like domain-containing protein n=1 Tax=Nocardia farcinica TaxID=37329 RepID=UPI0018959D1D|nr:phage integrase SAM-like domain-containing protein [Nocardia farcinica]MBF6259979.1 phage integrase SAM-like domain-containing protein [Nocardia farcinica]